MSRVRSWTDEEVGWLLDNDHISARAAGEELGRGRQSVQKMRQKLREGGAPLDAWTPLEDDIVRTTGHMKARDVVALLPTRTYHGVQGRRRHLSQTEGLAFGGQGARKNPGEVGTRPLLAKTCPKCGLLLTPKWFGRDTDSFWRAACIRCRPPQDRSGREKSPATTTADRHFYDRVQAFTKERATRNGEEWLSSDHEILDNPEATILTKALSLGRTYAAVASQCSKNGYPSLVGHGDPIKGQWVIDNPNAPAFDARMTNPRSTS